MNSVNERYLDWLNKDKTIFNIEKNIKTTTNLGEITPLGFFEALPGDTFNLEMSILSRVISPTIKATLENYKVSVMVYKVPLRLCYENFKKVMGERDDYEANPDSDYKIPEINFFDGDGNVINNYAKSIMSYFGIPVPSKADKDAGRKIHNINKILSNAYALIYNNHFRDENLQQAKAVDISDNNIELIAEVIPDPDNPGEFIPNPDADFNASGPDKYTGKLAKCNKNFDYFTNTFTDTQKGQEVQLSLAGSAPVVTNDNKLAIGATEPLRVQYTDGTLPADGFEALVNGKNTNGDNFVTLGGYTGTGAPKTNGVTPINLAVDLTGTTAIKINDLREAEKLQQQRELDLTAGTRYFEIINSYFGIRNIMAELDYPELVGAFDGIIDISQVVQTSLGLDGSTSQGNIAGYGVNAHSGAGINCMAYEHSVIIPVLVVTQKHTYQQGTHKFFNRREKNDFYFATQKGLGFQPIYKSEIYGNLTDGEKDAVFGFAPNAERYRKETNMITGMLNVNSADVNGDSNSLSVWAAGDIYDAPPSLTKDWKLEKPDFVDNTLAIGSELSDQFLFDIDMTGFKVSVVDALGIPKI